jgi:dienelactone hydrolase
VKERFVEIPTQDGRMETFVTHPEQDGPFPPVVFYMDVWGVREELYELARRVATVGYYAMVPDFYYRQGKVRSTFVNDKGERISLNRLSKEDQDKVLSPARQLTDAMVVEDSGAILSFLHGGGEPVKPTAVGSIGYCMGGRHVMAVAAHHPEHFRASTGLAPSSRGKAPGRALLRLRRARPLCATADAAPARGAAEALPSQVSPRDPRRRRARLRPPRPRYLSQAGSGAGLGAHLCNVPPPNPALFGVVLANRRMDQAPNGSASSESFICLRYLCGPRGFCRLPRAGPGSHIF